MPYIPKSMRKTVTKHGPASPGELNFVITAALMKYMASHPATYSTLNDVMGALEGAKLEFCRRVVVPYEESKRKSNGDVY